MTTQNTIIVSTPVPGVEGSRRWTHYHVRSAEQGHDIFGTAAWSDAWIAIARRGGGIDETGASAWIEERVSPAPRATLREALVDLNAAVEIAVENGGRIERGELAAPPALMTGADAADALIRMAWPALSGEVPEAAGDVLNAARNGLSRSARLVYQALLTLDGEGEKLVDAVEADDPAARRRMNRLVIAGQAIKARFVARTGEEQRSLFGEALERAEIAGLSIP